MPKPKKTVKQPKYKRLHLTVALDRGIAPLVATLDPPKGYVFDSATRKGTKAVIVYRKVP